VLERASARLADLVLCQSAEDVRTARRKFIVADDRLRPLGNGVDLRRFAPERFRADDRAAIRRRLGVRDRERVIGFVGRMVREKGIPELLEAIRERPGWRLLLVGPDERGAKRDAIDPAVFAGTRNATWLGLRSDLPPLFAVMDVVTLPSHREGLPRTLVEASAMARPVVATRVRGCREAVEDGVTGLLVPTRAPRELRDAIAALLDDPGRAARFGAAARRLAEQRFDERAVFERIERAYREIALPELPARALRPRGAAIASPSA
jgi:glycosyltransferase involved in cell wall biosynthesis